jgi:hypothetical protein
MKEGLWRQGLIRGASMPLGIPMGGVVQIARLVRRRRRRMRRLRWARVGMPWLQRRRDSGRREYCDGRGEQAAARGAEV